MKSPLKTDQILREWQFFRKFMLVMVSFKLKYNADCVWRESGGNKSTLLQTDNHFVNLS